MRTQAGPFAEQPATLEHLDDLGGVRVWLKNEKE